MSTTDRALSYRTPITIGILAVLLAGAIWIPFVLVRSGVLLPTTPATPVEIIETGGTVSDTVSGTVSVGEPGTSVIDEAGILYLPDLRSGLEELAFAVPNRVVILTQRPDQATADTAFNERVLDYMRAHHPELITTDGQKWADGVFIFGIDPIGRHLGTYLGEDLAVDLDTQHQIQQAAAESARAGNWTQAVLDGVGAGAAILNTSTWSRPGIYLAVSTIILVFGGVIVAIQASQISKRRKSVARLDEAEAAYAQVTFVLDETHLHAATIPSTPRYGAIMLAEYDRFKQDYRRLHDEIQSLNDTDLARFDNPTITAVSRKNPAERAQLEGLRSLARTIPDRLTQLHADLLSPGSTGSTGSTTPDDALDELKDLQLDLSQRLQRLY